MPQEWQAGCECAIRNLSILKAYVEDEDVTDPERAEAYRELEALYDYEKSRGKGSGMQRRRRRTRWDGRSSGGKAIEEGSKQKSAKEEDLRA